MTTEHRYAILVYENIAHVKRLVKRLYVGAFASVFNVGIERCSGQCRFRWAVKQEK